MTENVKFVNIDALKIVCQIEKTWLVQWGEGQEIKAK